MSQHKRKPLYGSGRRLYINRGTHAEPSFECIGEIEHPRADTSQLRAALLKAGRALRRLAKRVCITARRAFGKPRPPRTRYGPSPLQPLINDASFQLFKHLEGRPMQTATRRRRKKPRHVYRVYRATAVGGGSIDVEATSVGNAMHKARRLAHWKHYGSTPEGGFENYAIDILGPAK